MSYDEHLISQAGGDGDVPSRLAAIEARAQAATEGPWQMDEGSYHVYRGEDMICADLYTEPDAAFIANARTDVPALLALVREQQAKLDRILKLADWAGHRGWHIAPATLRHTINEVSA